MVVFLIQTCENKDPQNSKLSSTGIQVSEKKCFVSNIQKKNDKIFATVNFIEYQKIIDNYSDNDLQNRARDELQRL